MVISTYATPSAIGKVNVDSLTGFSQAFAPQLPVELAADDVVESRTAIVRSGRTLCIAEAILPIASPTGIRRPSLTISPICAFSIINDASQVPTKDSVARGRARGRKGWWAVQLR